MIKDFLNFLFLYPLYHSHENPFVYWRELRALERLNRGEITNAAAYKVLYGKEAEDVKKDR